MCNCSWEYGSVVYCYCNFFVLALLGQCCPHRISFEVFSLFQLYFNLSLYLSWCSLAFYSDSSQKDPLKNVNQAMSHLLILDECLLHLYLKKCQTAIPKDLFCVKMIYITIPGNNWVILWFSYRQEKVLL